MTERRQRSAFIPMLIGAIFLCGAGCSCLLPVAECPECNGHPESSSMFSIHFSFDRWQCMICHGKGKVTLLKLWTYEPGPDGDFISGEDYVRMERVP